MKVLAVILAALVLAASAQASVQVLGEAAFDETLGKYDISLVKFFAPWCGHCKKLAPEFEKAAEVLGEKALLAEVDCTTEAELCKRFSVQGYPTLIVFRKGVEQEKYSAGRDAAGIIAYIKSQSGPTVNVVSDVKDVPTAEAEGMSVCTIKTASETSELAKIANALAAKYRAVFTFYLVAGASEESVTVNRAGDETEVFDGQINNAALTKFFQLASVGFLGAVSPTTIQQYNELSGTPIGWLYLDQTDRDEIIKAVTPVAEKIRKELVMLWVDTDLYSGVGKQMGLAEDVKYPAFVIDIERTHYVFPADQKITPESIQEYIAKYLKGELKPTMMSEAEPEEHTKDGLTVMVGTSLPKFIETGKNVLVVFYAPWCGHCNSLHPIYEEYAKSVESDDTLIVGKIDATTNDFERSMFKVNGFPTIYFIPAGGSPMSFSGERTVEGFTEFVKKNAKKPAEKPKAADSDAEDL